MLLNKNCPKCEADFTGEEIPEQDRELFGGESHFSRLIAVEDPNIYDGVLFWECPDCSHQWNSEVGELLQKKREL